jgi:hypothetical protein
VHVVGTACCVDCTEHAEDAGREFAKAGAALVGVVSGNGWNGHDK